MMTRCENTRRRGFAYWTESFVTVLFASILPACAIYKTSTFFAPAHIGIYLTLVSLVTVYAYRSDTQTAKQNGWRTPERTLHLFELAGGWIAAFFAQRFLNHKIAKKEYQDTFWSIAVIQNYASFDFIHDWHYTKVIADFIASLPT